MAYSGCKDKDGAKISKLLIGIDKVKFFKMASFYVLHDKTNTSSVRTNTAKGVAKS